MSSTDCWPLQIASTMSGARKASGRGRLAPAMEAPLPERSVFSTTAVLVSDRALPVVAFFLAFGDAMIVAGVRGLVAGADPGLALRPAQRLSFPVICSEATSIGCETMVARSR